MSNLGSNFVVLVNTETDRRINLIKFRRLNQCEKLIHCFEFVFISIFSVLNWSYLLLQNLFSSVHYNYEWKNLNERRRTNYILPLFLYSYFIALPFTWSALFCLRISLFISISKVFLICWNITLLADSFSISFSKDIARLFSGSARTSANKSSLFSAHCLEFFVFLPFCLP